MSTQKITNIHRIPSWTDASADPVQSTVLKASPRYLIRAVLLLFTEA